MRIACLNLKLNLELSELIYKTLEPELQLEQSNADVSVSIVPEGLQITIKTEELSILRAALNSYIRWINCINSINNVLQR
jgi:tRNA threonylcarbamoyladenosine modification (KEOPS) complex  Pcc1 subunit